MDDFGYYIFALVVLVVGFLIVKKVATCLVKTIIGMLVLAILAGIYWVYIA
ncbi:sulfate transporter [Segatella hominis]|uniref:sulfate transporter n=1 Tax=Segatella hominis TaxID=2518605 RepID=UPI003AABDBAF